MDARGRIFLPGLHNWDYVGFSIFSRIKHDCNLNVSISLTGFHIFSKQPKSSVVRLLKEMTAKFEEHPPLSSKASADSQNPEDLLNFVTNLQISDGDPTTHLFNDH